MKYTGADVTVLVPTRDRRDMVLGALQSVTRQSTLPARILVVDDRSEDGTAGAVREFSRSAPVPIDLVSGPGRGVGPARNAGLDQVQTPLVCFLDSDDELAPEALQVGLEAFQAGDAMLVFSGSSFPGPARLLTKTTEGDRYSIRGLLGDER